MKKKMVYLWIVTGLTGSLFSILFSKETSLYLMQFISMYILSIIGGVIFLKKEKDQANYQKTCWILLVAFLSLLSWVLPLHLHLN